WTSWALAEHGGLHDGRWGAGSSEAQDAPSRCSCGVVCDGRRTSDVGRGRPSPTPFSGGWQLQPAAPELQQRGAVWDGAPQQRERVDFLHVAEEWCRAMLT